MTGSAQLVLEACLLHEVLDALGDGRPVVVGEGAVKVVGDRPALPDLPQLQASRITISKKQVCTLERCYGNCEEELFMVQSFVPPCNASLAQHFPTQ